MTQTQRLPSIGDRVLVDPRKVRDSIPDNLSIQLINDQVGTVLDYKMTDGTGVGVILKLSDGSTHWFFEEEISELPNSINSSWKDSISLSKRLLNKRAKGKSSQIVDLINPKTFIEWLLFSTKDIT